MEPIITINEYPIERKGLANFLNDDQETFEKQLLG